MTVTANVVKGVIAVDSLIDGSATGASVDLGRHALVGLVVPASMAGTSMTFQVSVDGGTSWFTLKDELGNSITVTFTVGSTGGFYSLRAVLPMGCMVIRPVSQASETTKTVTFVGQEIA